MAKIGTGYRVEVGKERNGVNGMVDYDNECVIASNGIAEVLASMAFREDLDSIVELRIMRIGPAIHAGVKNA